MMEIKILIFSSVDSVPVMGFLVCFIKIIPSQEEIIDCITANDFVAVRDGTTDFIDFDSDGDLDVIYTGTCS